MEALVSSLAFLQQVGLTPHRSPRGGPQLDAEMEAAGLRSGWWTGSLHHPGGAGVVRRVFQLETSVSWRRCRRQGSGHLHPLRGLRVTTWAPEVRSGGSGHPGGDRRHRGGHLGGIHPGHRLPGGDRGRAILNINADWAANELVKRLQPYKIIFLTRTGGLLDERGKVIDSINLSAEYERLMQQPWLHSGMRVKIQQIHDLLMEPPPPSSCPSPGRTQMPKSSSPPGSGPWCGGGSGWRCTRRGSR